MGSSVEDVLRSGQFFFGVLGGSIRRREERYLFFWTRRWIAHQWLLLSALCTLTRLGCIFLTRVLQNCEYDSDGFLLILFLLQG